MLIALLGLLSTLVGVIFTQVWNGRLETRRWERERGQQHQADLREDKNRTYEHRREAYVAFLRDFDRLRRAYTDFGGPSQPSREIFDALWDYWAIVMVYGTPEAKDVVQRCGDALGIFQARWINNTVDDDTLDEVMTSWDELLKQVRRDLGVAKFETEGLPPVTEDRT